MTYEQEPEPKLTTVIATYSFVVEVEDPTDKNEVIAAVNAYINGVAFALDEPNSIIQRIDTGEDE